MPSPLEPEELGSLMAAIGEAGQAARNLGPEPVPVDLTNPERNIPEPMPALEAAHERLGAQFARAVAGRTRRHFAIYPGRIVRARGDELRDLMAPPAVIAVLDVLHSRAQGLLILERNLAEGLLSAGLGLAAGAEALEPGDDQFTHLERLVLRRILSLIERPVFDAYRDITKLGIKVARIESDPRLAEVIDPRDVALMASFTARGELEGSFKLALPFSVLERARQELVRLPPRDIVPPPPTLLTRMRSAVEHVKVQVDVDLGRRPSTMARVAGLRAGDIVALDADENTPLAVRVNGLTKLWGFPTVSDGSLAVEVTALADKLGDPDGIPLGYGPDGGADQPGADLEKQGTSPALPEASMADTNPDESLAMAAMPTAPLAKLDLDDVQVHITVRLGRTTLTIGEVMQMQTGSVIKLDKAAGESLDVLVNGRLIGKGEAVVVGDRFGVRLTSVLEKDDLAGGQ